MSHIKKDYVEIELSVRFSDFTKGCGNTAVWLIGFGGYIVSSYVFLAVRRMISHRLGESYENHEGLTVLVCICG